MHDFCFTIPYGFAVLAGGVLGYLRRGSSASLAGGAGVGTLLLLAGVVSLKAFEKRRNSYLALAVETQFGIQDGRSFVGDGPGRYRGSEGAGRAINLGFV